MKGIVTSVPNFYSNQGQGVESENVSLTQDKSDEVCKEIENRGIKESMNDEEINEGNKMDRINADKTRYNGNCDNIEEVEVTGTEDLNGVKETGDKKKKSYASAASVGSHKDFSKKLFEMPTETDKYNLRKMWGRLGFKDIVDKLDIHVCLDKRELANLPIWVRLCNVPLESWTTNGISALASRIGNPLVMDNVTAEMCTVRFGRVRFARVLVEVSAKKSLPNEIEIGMCKKNKPAENHVVDNNETIKDQGNDAGKNSEKNGFLKSIIGSLMEKEKEASDVSSKEATGVSSTPNISPIKNAEVQSNSPNGSSSRGKVWSVHKDVLNDIRKSANKYFILEELDDDHNSAKVNDVYADENGIEFKIGCWNIRGLSTSDKQNEVRKFISNESLSIVHYCKQYVLCKLEAIKGDLFMFCTIIYAANEGFEIMELWKDQRQYKRVVGNNACAIMGDMNVTLDPKEHSVGCSFIFKDMNDFKECVNDIEVEYVTSSSLFFTWTKNLYKTKYGDNHGVLKKLDRAMGNEILICKHPQTHAIFLPYLISDHCHVVLVIPNSVHARKKAFRFSNFVANKKEFKDEVAKKDGDIFENVKDLRDRLKDVQSKIDVDSSNKKAKIKWLSVGDMNNEFFHRVVKSRNHKNRVNAIHDEDGSGFEGDHVAAQFVKYFQNFLGKNVLVCKIDDMGVLFKNKLRPDEAEFMVRDVSNEEIKQPIFLIDDNKAPGPDGFSTYFYKKAWDIISNDICSAVKEFFLIGKILNEINSTNIALVPKIQTLAKVSDYRPIACYNVIFKCISKILTERMKKCLGRLSFLKDILRGFGFHDRMVLWIMKCVTTKSFSVIINGESQGYFKGGRGIIHGDPMSPYLSTLIIKVLNLLVIRRIENCSGFQYHFGCSKLKITHVCFADDLLMFIHGDKEYVRIMKDSTKEFGKVSGLLPNYNKSTIVFRSVKEKDRRDILEGVPFKVEKLLATVFLLPQAIIDEINSLLKGFLWNQEEKA
ncbi:RNA-directed DNA polymerase, eukaryota, reverse transcriptase zinc-binding domain protein, partial [Tanacetum coccineum]